jgi:hypothetical protein
LIAAGAQIEAAGDKLGEQVSVKVELRRVIGVSSTARSVAEQDSLKSSSKCSEVESKGERLLKHQLVAGRSQPIAVQPDP